MPNLMAYDLCGVQPMSGPTGLIFAMKSNYQPTGTEALGLDEAETAFSGDAGTLGQDVDGSGMSGFDSTGGRVVDAVGRPMSTEKAEGLGRDTGDFQEMGFTIEKTDRYCKVTCTKGSEYSLELAQDLKAIHGLDAETELANILSTEILAEINREIVRSINFQDPSWVYRLLTLLYQAYSIYQQMLMVVGLLRSSRVLQCRSNAKQT